MSKEFNWSDYITLAEELKQRTDSEAALRSAISRAYYAVFCRVRDKLKKEGVPLPERDIHFFVWKQFKGKGRTHLALYYNGNGLRENRNTADYEPEIHNLDSLVDDSFRRVRNIVSTLDSIQKAKSK